MLELDRQPWGPPHPPAVGAPQPEPEPAPTGRLLPPPDVRSPLVPAELPPPGFHPEMPRPPQGHPIEPEDARPPRDRRRALVGVLAATAVLGVMLVGFGVFDSSDGTSSVPSSPVLVDPTGPPANDTADADPAGGSLPLGTAAPVGDRYVVTMTAVDLDATELIVAHDPTNEPPGAGDAYVMVTLDVNFTGVGQGEPYFDLVVGAMDDREREFYDVDCLAVAPGDMFGLAPLATGEGLVGTFCLAVPLAATDSLTFFVAEHGSIANTPVWWSAAD
jgi:hypothetical protein